MSLAAQAASDLVGIFACRDLGEPTRHRAADGTETDLVATWSPAQLDDLGAGFVADASRVLFPAAQLRRCERSELLLRNPDAVDTLLLQDGWALLTEDGAEAGLESSGAETWRIDQVIRGPGLWDVTARKDLRPVPRERATLG